MIFITKISLGVGVVICLEWGADCLHMVQLMPLYPKTPSSLAWFKSRLVLPLWYRTYRLIQAVLEKRPINGCSSSSSCASHCWPLCTFMNDIYYLLVNEPWVWTLMSCRLFFDTGLWLWCLQGYDHGYYFISTFIGEHIAYHAKFLNPWTPLWLCWHYLPRKPLLQNPHCSGVLS